MRLILVPTWFKESLDSKHGNLDRFYDLEYLSSIVSKQDLAIYTFINSPKFLESFFPQEILKSFRVGLSYKNLKKEVLDIIEQVEIEYKHFNHEIGLSLLFNHKEQTNQFCVLGYDQEYITIEPYFPLKEVFIETNNMKESLTNHEKPLHFQLLTVLNELKPIHDIAKLPLFRYAITH